MTGFARADGRSDTLAWTLEARSVNGKSLDVRCRFPAGWEELELAARTAAAARFKRGNVALTVTLDDAGANARYRINRGLLDQVLALRAELADVTEPGPPGLTGLLGIRGMLEPVDEALSEPARAARDKAFAATLDDALTNLAAMRAEEGARIATILGGRLDAVADLVARAEASAAAQPAAIKARLVKQLAELLEAAPALPEERLAQEAALLAGKADVREELDRLAAHVAAVRDLIDADGESGRRLNFLCQELLREANTVCSKAAELALTNIGLELKEVIEQLREQVQNVE